VTTLEFDHEELFRVLRGDDPIERDLARLICHYKLATEDLEDKLTALNKRLWKKQRPPKSARRRKWTDDAKLQAYIAIEGQHRADQEIEPGCSIRASIPAKFDAMPRRGPRVWRILTDLTGTKKHLEIKSPETARIYHRDGAVILGGLSPAQEAWLSSVADYAAHSINKTRLGKKLITK
jgi:hypothetical protein